MLKQWSRFGSGCYEYECSGGLVNVVIRNVSFPCSRAGVTMTSCYSLVTILIVGQEIPVELIQRSTGGETWLHSGGVQCPRCEELCGECGAQTGERQVTWDLGPGA